VEAVLRGYCEKEALAGAADTEVTLDPCLSDVLFKGLLKRGDLWPTRLPKTELTAALIKRLAPHHVVLRGKEQVGALVLPCCAIALLPYCPIALLPYCPIALLPYCPIAQEDQETRWLL
jgi:hypothetical protein